MRSLIFGATSMVAAIAYGAGATLAQETGNRATFANSGQTATLECAGGKARVLGSNNVLTVAGGCSALEVAGSGNRIAIQFAAGASAHFLGSGNTISWTSADGKPPKVSSLGFGNRVEPPLK